MKLLPLALLLNASVAFAAPVRVDVLEKSTGTTTSYRYDVDASTVKKAETGPNQGIPQFSKYSAADRKLVANRVVLSAADDVLYQCEVDGFDLVVVRVEHNSFSNPLRVLVAFSGHPIQVSTIYVVKIKNNTVVSRRELIHKPASYDWAATVSR